MANTNPTSQNINPNQPVNSAENKNALAAGAAGQYNTPFGGQFGGGGARPFVRSRDTEHKPQEEKAITPPPPPPPPPIIAPSKSENVGWSSVAPDQFTRGSQAENIAIKKEQERAGKIYPNFANKDYLTGGTPKTTVGGVETPQSKALGSRYSWENLGKSIGQIQFTRGSQAEKEAITREANRAAGIPLGSGKSVLLSENVRVSDKLGISPSSSSTSVKTMSEKDFTSMLTKNEKLGAEFIIYADKTPIGKTSGSRSYYDYLSYSGNPKYAGKEISIQTTFPTTERELISSVELNPHVYALQPESYWQGLGQKGILSSQGVNKINDIFKEYFFAQNPVPTDYISSSAKSSTLAKTSILPSDLTTSSSAAFKGLYIDTTLTPVSTFGIKYEIPRFAAQDLSQASKGLSLPFGVGAFGESAQNFGAFFFQGGKSTIAVGSALATESYDILRTGKSGAKTIAPNAGAFLSGVYYPQSIWSERANKKSESALSQVHEFGLYSTLSGRGPNFVTNAKTSGAEFGLLASGVVSVYGFKDIIPLRITKIPLPYTEGTKIPTGLSLGYEGSRSQFLIGIGGGKLFIGQPKAENLQLTKLAETTTRYGFESGAGKPLVNKVITEVAVPDLLKSGRISEAGALAITETGKEALPLALKSPSIPQREGFGEKPFRSLTPSQSNVLFGFVKEKGFTVTGSTAEIPFTSEPYISGARDIDIKGVKLEAATKYNLELAPKLNEVALSGQTFVPEGKSLFLNIKEGFGTVRQEKILEFPQKEEKQEGSVNIDTDYVFGKKTPFGTSKVKGIKTVKYDYQGMRKLASSTEFHIGKGGFIDIRAASGRELKDPAHVYSYLKTKAKNYFTVGKAKQGRKLDIFAENYRARFEAENPTMKLSTEFTGVKDTTLHYEAFPKENRFANAASNIKPIIERSVLSISEAYPSRVSSSGYSIFQSTSPSSRGGSSRSMNILESSVSKGIYPSRYRLQSSRLFGFGSKSNYPSRGKSRGGGKPSGASRLFSGGSKGSYPITKISITPTGPSKTGGGAPSTILGSKGGGYGGGGGSKVPGIINITIPKKLRKIPLIKIGSLPLRRRYGKEEGPTRIFKYNVKNIFAGSLSINEKGNQ